MGAVIIVLIIWSIIAFIVSKVKDCSFWEACKIMLLDIFKEATSSSSGTSAAMDKARRKAERAGRDDIVDAIDEKQANLGAMNAQFTQMYRDTNQSNNDDD